MFAAMPIFSQQTLMQRGKVTRADGVPLVGVSVVEADLSNRTVNATSTDQNGLYVLPVSDQKNNIVFSYIGYNTLHTSIDKVGNVTVLKESSKQIDEITISSKRGKPINNGTGLNIDKRNLTTSVVTINAKDLEELPSVSIDQALQGRLSGVDIISSSGDPGAGMQIRIRGTSSINSGSDPLIVVDGMPYETTVPSDFSFGTANEQGYAQLLNIAPSDILDITVLKDAAATAVWGSRAANGVLIINTKRGEEGTPSLNYSLRTVLNTNREPLSMLSGDQYSQLIPEMYMNRNGSALNTETYKEFAYDIRDPYNYYNYSNNTNWVKEVTQLGYVLDNNLSLSGGGERTKYFASIGYFDQKGTTLGTGLKRINSRVNLDYSVSDKLSFRTDIAYTRVDNAKLYAKNVLNVAYKKMPNMAVYEFDEQGNQTPNYFSPIENIQGTYPRTYNPVAFANTATNRVLSERITPKFNVRYDLIPQVLVATSDILFDVNSSKTNTFLPQTATGRPIVETVVNRASDEDYDTYKVDSKTNLVYTPSFRDPRHQLQALLSFQTSDYTYYNQYALTSNTASVFLPDPSSPSRTANEDLTIYSQKIQARSIAGLWNAQYGYDDRYLVNAALRVDGNSKFGPENRFGLFPAISLRWRASGESFLKGLSFLDDLSFRLSYAQAGNAPKSDYTYFSTYTNFDWTYQGEAAVYARNLELRNLKWETVTGQNVGFNLVMFNNKLNVDAELYRNRTSDLFFPELALMTYSGYNNVDMNVGTMDNQGWEISVFTTPWKNKDWQLDVNFNLSHNENIIRSISDLYPRENVKEITTNGIFKAVLQENNPFGSFYGFRYQGVYADEEATLARDKNGNRIIGLNGDPIYMRFNYPATDYIFQPGDAKYEDVNHDGTIDYRDIVYLGNTNPRLSGGFGTTLTYKNWKLITFFNFRYKFDVINATEMETTNMYNFDNQSTAVLRRWRKEGDVTDIPRAVYNTGYNWLGSSRYVQDGTFLRLRQLTVRYDLKKEWLKKANLKGVGLYLTGENLLLFTRYTGQDPEISTRITGPFSIGVDESMTPTPVSITFGANVRF